METKGKIKLISSTLALVCSLLLFFGEAMAVCRPGPALSLSPIEQYYFDKNRARETSRLFDLAQGFYKKKEYEQAIEHFEKCLHLSPDYACANNGLAWILLTCEDHKYRNLEKALKHAEKAVTGGGLGCGACWDTLGLANYLSGHIQKAHICYLKSMTLLGNSNKEATQNYIDFLTKEKPARGPEAINLVQSLTTKTNVPELHKKANRLLFKEKRPLDAIDVFTVELLISPDHPQASIIHFSRAQAWFKLRADNTALSDTEKAIEKSPGFADAYELRGRIFAINGMRERALEYYDKAVVLSPDNGTFWNNRGLTHLMMRNYREAVADFNKAILISPSHPDQFYNRALAYKGLKNYESAIDDLKKVLNIDPSHKRAQLTLKYLIIQVSHP
ncbi:tetratricopeptide repeat protein [Thermodesulfobacteriota bacterium]